MTKDFTEEEKIDILEKFIGGRYISNNTETYLKNKFEKIDETIYRGIPFPKHLIKKGYVMEEWYGSSHWSLDFNIARNIFSNDDSNINQDYVEELAEEFNISYEEAEKLFVPIVLKLNKVSLGVRIYNLVKDLDKVSRFYKEKEITTIGIDTIIKKIELKTDKKGEYYLIEVEEVIQTGGAI